MIKITKCIADEIPVNSYIIEKNGKCIVVDPYDISIIEEGLNANDIDYIILTHEHFDHIKDADKVREKYNAKLICQQEASDNIQCSRKNRSKMSKLILKFMKSNANVEEFSINKADISFEKFFKLRWQDENIEFYHAPGHSKGGLVFKLNNNLFVGDNLFEKVDTNRNGLSKDRQKYDEVTWPLLKSFDKEMMVYSGHYKEFFLKDRIKD